MIRSLTQARDPVKRCPDSPLLDYSPSTDGFAGHPRWFGRVLGPRHKVSYGPRRRYRSIRPTFVDECEFDSPQSSRSRRTREVWRNWLLTVPSDCGFPAELALGPVLPTRNASPAGLLLALARRVRRFGRANDIKASQSQRDLSGSTAV